MKLKKGIEEKRATFKFVVVQFKGNRIRNLIDFKTYK